MPISRRRLLAAGAGAATAFGVVRFAPAASANAGPQSYTASWASVDQHPAAPTWFQDAKFGIYYHWGVFSVPAFSNEWYPRNMYNSGSIENQHHIATYAALDGAGSTTAGAAAVLWAPNSNTNNHWTITPAGWVKVVNATSGLVLDSGGNVASGSALKQWSWNGSTNLQWHLEPLGGGYYRIVNNTNGMVADSWGNTGNGVNCLQAAWNGGNNQQWTLNLLSNGNYQIINRGTGTALDGAGSTTAGASTVLWTPNSSTNNHWTVVGL